MYNYNNFNYLDNRSNSDSHNEIKPINHKSPHSKNKKFDFCKFKKNTFKSLNEVEYFLNNFDKAIKCIKLYKILK